MQNAKRASYKQLEKKCKELEKRCKELQELLIAVAENWDAAKSREFRRFRKSLTKTINRKLTKKDLEDAGKIVKKHREKLRELFLKA